MKVLKDQWLQKKYFSRDCGQYWWIQNSLYAKIKNFRVFEYLSQNRIVV